MPHMQLETRHGRWYLVEGRDGTDIVPGDLVGNLDMDVGQMLREDDDSFEYAAAMLRDYCDGRPPYRAIEAVVRHGARYSAPGYLDCASWCLGLSSEEAVQECKELFGTDEDVVEMLDREDYPS